MCRIRSSPAGAKNGGSRSRATRAACSPSTRHSFRPHREAPSLTSMQHAVPVHPVQNGARRIVEAPWFEPFMIGLILFNAVLIGLETFPEIEAEYEDLLHLGNHVILAIFIVEAALKITAVAPRFGRY